MKPPRSIAQILADTGPILLDFDGPICTLFATTPAPLIAQQLRHTLTGHGAPIPPHIASQTDPLQVLRYTATLGDPTLTLLVDDQLRQAELDAITGATPTPHARELITAAHHARRPLAIISNNSEPAIHAYLTNHHLTLYIRHVTGRAHGRPDLMKPNPAPILATVTALNTTPAACVMIGDSPTDIQAGHAAGVHTIGHANKPGKLQALISAGADAITEGTHGLAQLASAIHKEANAKP
jgi:HAD superfamily hydrolase (TIGR01509 family)